MLAGDVIKVTAAGKWTNTSGTTGNTQIRLYWNPGTNQLADLNGPISDTGNNVQLTTGQSNIEWWYFALITVRSSGTGGTAWCDSFIENVTNPTSFNQMAGVGAFVAVHEIGRAHV